MHFKSSDYSLSYDSFFPFDLYHSTTSQVTLIRKTNKALIYTSNNYVTILTEEKEKQIRFDSEVSALDTKSKLIVAGDTNGCIKLFNRHKLQLGSFDEHKTRINDLVFTTKQQFASASNDKTVRVFDIMHKKSTKIFDNHSDFVNCLFTSDNLLMSGGFDGKVYVHDLRSNEKVNEFSFEHGINKISMLDENRLIVSEKYKMHCVDLRATQNVQSAYAHMKEVSSLKVYNSMIYSTSHDGTLKTFNSNLKMHSQIKFNDKIFACHIYNDDIFVGLENGNILNLVKEEKNKKEVTSKPEKPLRYYTDDKDVDIKRIKHNKSVKNEYEKLINNNHHWVAFTKILKEVDVDLVFGVLSHIYAQSGFGKVLLDRNEEEIKVLVDFVIDNFFVIDYRMILHKIISIVISMYDEYFMNNVELRERIMFLSELIDEEKVFQEEAIILYSFGDALTIN